MGMTYTYDTGKITRDFHLLKPYGKSCTKSNLPPGVHCIGRKIDLDYFLVQFLYIKKQINKNKYYDKRRSNKISKAN